MKLSELLPRLKPCSYLSQTAEGKEGTPSTYLIKSFLDLTKKPKEKVNGPNSPKYYKRKGRAKETRLSIDCKAAYLSQKLRATYRFLLEGSRVEIHLRPRRQSTQTVDWALTHNLSLRPDVILAAMPRGTIMLAPPATTDWGKAHSRKPEVFWVLEHPKSLKRVNVTTPKKIRRLATWQDIAIILARERPPEKGPADQPPLSDLVPAISSPETPSRPLGLVTGNPEEMPRPASSEPL